MVRVMVTTLCVAEACAVPSTLQLLVAPGSIRIVDMLVDHRKIIRISMPPHQSAGIKQRWDPSLSVRLFVALSHVYS